MRWYNELPTQCRGVISLFMNLLTFHCFYPPLEYKGTCLVCALLYPKHLEHYLEAQCVRVDYLVNGHINEDM